MKEKHLPYFTLLKFLNSKECALCSLITNSVNSYFESLLYENINDINFRKKFREQNGFCNFHSYKFFRYYDTLAIVLTYKDLLVQTIEKYYKIKKRKKFINKQKKGCIICNIEKDAEKRYTTEFYHFLEDEEFKQEFLKTKGLCIPHFEFFIKTFKTLPEWFLEFNINQYKLLLKQCNNFLEYLNFTSEKKKDLSDEEKIVWKKLVHVVSGYEGMKLC